MALKVFVIILNYIKYQDTKKCIKSLLKSDIPKGTEIVCVDNSPTEDSSKYLINKFPKIQFIKAKKNMGFAGGNNLGIKYALKNNATHILIINPDVIISKFFFNPLFGVFAQNKKTGLVAPAIKHYQNGKLFYGLEGNVDWHIGKAKHINLSSKPQQIRPAQFVTFACVLISTEVFKSIGLLDDGYFMYLEDVDFCLQAKKAGFKIYLNPTVIVQHNTSSSFKKPTDKLIISFRSQIRFVFKWLKFPYNIIGITYATIFYPYLYLLWTYHYYKTKFNI